MVRFATTLRTLSIVLGIGALALAGCGKKGDPRPPIRMIPATPTDLEAIQRDERLLLSFPYPSTTAAGTPLSAITEVTVWRLLWEAPASEDGGPPRLDELQFTAGARPDRVIEGDAVKDAVRGDRIELAFPLPSPEEPPGPGEEAIVTLAVKATGPTGAESSFSNLVSFVIRDAPDPPTGLALEGTAGGIEVRWRAPETEELESPETEEPTGSGGLRGFNVYRRLATDRAYAGPLRSVGREARKLLDESALFGQRYIYTVTAVDRRRPALVESGFGGEAEIVYRDRFAPPVPVDVAALAQEDRVRIVWRAVEDPDLAGYRVYRRNPASQEFAPLTDEPVAGTDLVDRDVRTGASYTYRVTAVDRSDNESEPSEQVTTTVR